MLLIKKNTPFGGDDALGNKLERHLGEYQTLPQKPVSTQTPTPAPPLLLQFPQTVGTGPASLGTEVSAGAASLAAQQPQFVSANLTQVHTAKSTPASQATGLMSWQLLTTHQLLEQPGHVFKYVYLGVLQH